jgi:hypothetical protein
MARWSDRTLLCVLPLLPTCRRDHTKAEQGDEPKPPTAAEQGC